MTPISGPTKGQTAYVVDEAGATFAFADQQAAQDCYDNEQAAGAEELELWAMRVPSDGMTWDDVADHACSHGPDTTTGVTSVVTPTTEEKS